MTKNVNDWLRGLIAALIVGGAGGVVTGFAAIGIDPEHFNLTNGMHATFQIAGIACLMHAVLGIAMFLQKSPLPGNQQNG